MWKAIGWCFSYHQSHLALRRDPAYRVEHNQETQDLSQFDARLENFLFAEIGTAESGATLTMI